MQDIHSIGGGARFFAGDRRLRPHNQPVNCPRCDSVNTKFCYYNNYNLSQPRHFCKSCRRYWTNGGVLRNVPVGGGCRKPKRSKPKQNPDSTSAVVSTADFTTQPPEDQLNSPDSHSSSESSSLSATATEVISVGNYSISDQNNKLIGNSSLNPSFETASFPVQGGECGMFQFQLQEMGSITSLTTSRAKETPSFDTPLSQGQSKDEEEWRMQGMIDPTIQDEYLTVLQSGRSSGAAGFGPLDWNEAGGGGGYFDLPPSGVDHVYWSQSQWNYD